MNLYEDLGQALNPIAARDIMLSVNSEQQSFSSAYRESISKLASGIYNATDTLLSMLRPPQLELLRKMLQERGIVASTPLNLKAMETADVLVIMELAEKMILSC